MSKNNVAAHYKAKCHKMEEKIKEMVFLNTALESQAGQYSLRVRHARSDRQILLNKLLAHEASEDKATENKILHTMLSKKNTSGKDKNISLSKNTNPSIPATTGGKKKKMNGENSTTE